MVDTRATLRAMAERLCIRHNIGAQCLDRTCSACVQERAKVHQAIDAAYSLGLSQAEARLKQTEFDNHHNALTCPYCNPDNKIQKEAEARLTALEAELHDVKGPQFTKRIESVTAGFKQRAEKAEADLASCEARLRAQHAQMEWQPIETAPKDGTRILCWGPQLKVAECEWRYEARGGFSETRGWFRSNQFPEVHPTQWLPLPDPPLAAILDQSRRPERG